MIVIRLKGTGKKGRRQWRIVVADRRVARNGRLFEEIGFYDPLREPPIVQIKKDRYDEWVQKGAQPSASVKHLIKRARESTHAD